LINMVQANPFSSKPNEPMHISSIFWRCVLTFLTSSTRNGYKIHLYRRHNKCKGIS
jgi:hypothetical protein